MTEPRYLRRARQYVGTTEIAGKKHNPTIIKWLITLGAWWQEDETPWCGVFVGVCLKEFGYKIPKLYMRAKAWLDYGTAIEEPCLGCIVIFERKGGGHVGFVVGKDNTGRLMVLGGNQGNTVNIAPFTVDRVLGYRMPEGFWLNPQPLPTLLSGGKSSTNEA